MSGSSSPTPPSVVTHTQELYSLLGAVLAAGWGQSGGKPENGDPSLRGHLLLCCLSFCWGFSPGGTPDTGCTHHTMSWWEAMVGETGLVGERVGAGWGAGDPN